MVMILPIEFIQEVFECLKERISSGWKKKRILFPTVSIRLRDKPPIGAFTKHVWKITSIIHLLHIFQSTVVSQEREWQLLPVSCDDLFNLNTFKYTYCRFL